MNITILPPRESYAKSLRGTLLTGLFILIQSNGAYSISPFNPLEVSRIILPLLRRYLLCLVILFLAKLVNSLRSLVA